MVDKKKKKIIIISVGVTCLLIVIIVPIAIELSQSSSTANGSTDGDRIECFPFRNMVRQNCTSSGCLWSPSDTAPSCHLPDSSIYGYTINGKQTDLPNNRGFKVDLKRKSTFQLFGGDIDEIVFEVNYYNDQSLAFVLYPKNSDRNAARPPVIITEPSGEVGSSPLYQVTLDSTDVGQPFNFKIIRTSSKAVLFDTSLGGLTVAEQFLMISTKLPSHYLYGFGENTHDSFLHDMKYRTWPIFARDQSPDYHDVNLYGAHPFYMVCEDDGSSHGVFFLNSHSIDVTTMPNPGLTLRTIGGQLEFFIFLGPSAEEVVQQYTDVIGRPWMPPYWSLGFQLSRWGYKNLEHIQTVVNRTRAAGIPQDIQYADIDYMDGFVDFTLDETNFGKLPQYVDDVKEDGLRFIIILDPGIISNRTNYPTYPNGINNNVFIKWANSTIKPEDQQPNSDVLLGYVWPQGKTAFPDFFKNSTKEWWTNEIETFYEKLKFDALWIDMNEPANFNTNQDHPWNWPEDELPYWSLHCPENKWDDPPYETMAAHSGRSQRLSDNTICMVTSQGERDEYLHYSVHNLYGYSQAIATQSAVREVTGKRSMVLSRSTFAGSGHYTGHWLGDNFSRWSNLKDSIIGMMEFNMFGIPYIGADICGFIFDTTEEMCERWMELGAFYPFSRNHNNKDAVDQDPGLWPSVADAGRKALLIRYRLLPYLYTLFYYSHTTGSTVVRPLYHEYPKDLRAREIDGQFLWGAAFMVTPVLEANQSTVSAYFPSDVWYDYYTGALAKTGEVVLDAPHGYINLHIRGGYILPAQKAANNTMYSRLNPFELLVALKDGKAVGNLFWDDGDSLDTISNGEYQINKFEYINNTLSMTVELGNNWNGINETMNYISIMGMSSKPSKILVGDIPLSEEYYIYDKDNQRLGIFDEFSMVSRWQMKFEF